jgi:hypothetical protein
LQPFHRITCHLLSSRSPFSFIWPAVTVFLLISFYKAFWRETRKRIDDSREHHVL